MGPCRDRIDGIVAESVQIDEQENKKERNEQELDVASFRVPLETVGHDDEAKAVERDEDLGPRGREYEYAAKDPAELAQGVRHVRDANAQRGQDLNERDRVGECADVVNGKSRIEDAHVRV